MIRKTAGVSGTVKSIARQTNAFIDSSRGPKGNNVSIEGFSYEDMAGSVIAGINEEGQYNVGEEERPAPTQDILFDGLRDFEVKYNSSAKVISYSHQKQKVNIGHKIEDIVSKSKSLLPLYNDIIIDAARFDQQLADLRNRSNSSVIEGKTDILSNAICNKKYELINYVESSYGLSWRGMDDAWFIVTQVGFELNHYANSIREYFNSLVKIENLDGYENDRDPSLLKVLIHNANILEALSKFKSIQSLINSCFGGSASGESISSVADPITVTESSPVEIRISTSTRVLERVDDGTSDILIRNPERKNSMTIDIPGATKNQILSQITRSKADTSKQIFVHPDITPRQLTVGDRRIQIQLTKQFKETQADLRKTIFSFKDQNFSILKRQFFELRAENQENINLGCSFAIVRERTPPTASGSPASDGVFAENKEDITKVGESTTQSTYYEINYKGKKITTTISEFIKNNGYYNINGKKVKLKLSDAKPKGISDAKKKS